MAVVHPDSGSHWHPVFVAFAHAHGWTPTEAKQRRHLGDFQGWVAQQWALWASSTGRVRDRRSLSARDRAEFMEWLTKGTAPNPSGRVE